MLSVRQYSTPNFLVSYLLTRCASNTSHSPLLDADWSNCSRLTLSHERNVSTALIGCRIFSMLSASFRTNSPLHCQTQATDILTYGIYSHICRPAYKPTHFPTDDNLVIIVTCVLAGNKNQGPTCTLDLGLDNV